MIVMKFGGTSIASAKEIDHITNLVINEPNRKVVVVSAMAGVTNKLLDISNRIVDMPSTIVEKECDKFCDEFLSMHISAAEGVIGNKRINGDIANKIKELVNELRITLIGVGYLEDLSPKSLDYILSFGERLSVLIVSGALGSKGVKSNALTGYEAGIVTDSNFGCARPVYGKIRDSIKDKLMPLIDDGILPVVTGFIAADNKARITTMGRGGSDYTASLIGRFLNVKEVQIWTDVDGILTTDPKVLPSARLIPKLSYIEAMDLAYFGAKVIHSKMIEPAMVADIPVRIKNTFNPGGGGTLIVRTQEKIEKVIKAVTISKEVDIVNLKGIGMAETPNIAGRLFTLLGENNINIIMISGSSESNLSFIISKSDAERAIELLNERFIGNGIGSLEVTEDVCIIAVVGVGMVGTKGIAARIFQTVADNDVNIIMIAQGSSEVNISFVVKSNDGGRVIKALHERFIEDEIQSN
jgi:aspartate kinase